MESIFEFNRETEMPFESKQISSSPLEGKLAELLDQIEQRLVEDLSTPETTLLSPKVGIQPFERNTLKLRCLRSHSLPLAVLVMSCAFISSVIGCAPPLTKSEPPPPRVTVQHPENREIVDYNVYNGWMAASQVVEVRSRVRGHIEKVHFTDGQFVTKDQLLFELDPRPFQAEIQVAEGQIEVDKAQLEFAQAEEDRETELFEKKVSTKATLQQKVAARKSWESKLAAAGEEVRRRKLELEYARITAAVAGKISRAQLVAGNLVNAGGSDPLLTTIVALDPIFVYFFVDERSLLQYRERNGAMKGRSQNTLLKDSQIPFEFGLETDDGFPNKGVLDFSDNRIDSGTGTIEVRGVTDNSQSKFLPGSRVRVRIPISEPYSALLVPDTAILSDQDQRYVLALNSEKVVVRRNVEMGRLLSDGMRVILPRKSDDHAVSVDDW
ncbi:MAG: efflux RND transporter periplasmic adaptor subunit, partial [Planctomycetes bacterium]|nr:efflux RND transporter periplasmic adaptor subunit [Planctomycetota bacterium]